MKLQGLHYDTGLSIGFPHAYFHMNGYQFIFNVLSETSYYKNRLFY